MSTHLHDGDKHLLLIKQSLKSSFPQLHQTPEVCSQTKQKQSSKLGLSLARLSVRLLPADCLYTALEEASKLPSLPTVNQR